MESFPIQNGLKQGYALLPLLLNFALFRMCHQEGPRKLGRTGTEWSTSALGLCWQG